MCAPEYRRRGSGPPCGANWRGRRQRLGRRPLASIFFGGGTPSLMEPATVAALIADASAAFDAAPDLEITLEANPTSVEAGRLAAFPRRPA